LYSYHLATTQTACQRHHEREKNMKNPLPGRVIPICDENGNYASKQCFGESTNGKSFCSCWSKDGDIITSPSRTLETCLCHLTKYKATKERGMIEMFINDNQK